VAPDPSTQSSFNVALRFEPNRGRTDARGNYLLRADAYTLYRGIDVDCYSSHQRLKYDFVVAGVDPRAIRLRLTGGGNG
jgi:hypothetical protein